MKIATFSTMTTGYSNQEATALLARTIVSCRSGPVETIPISQPASSERRST